MQYYTDLTGENFQNAHQALCEKKRKHTHRNHMLNKRDVVQAVAIAVGIAVAIALLTFAGSTGLARGTGWHVGDYANAPAWND